MKNAASVAAKAGFWVIALRIRVAALIPSLSTVGFVATATRQK
jgi:hypothetical protein